VRGRENNRMRERERNETETKGEKDLIKNLLFDEF